MPCPSLLHEMTHSRPRKLNWLLNDNPFTGTKLGQVGSSRTHQTLGQCLRHKRHKQARHAKVPYLRIKAGTMFLSAPRYHPKICLAKPLIKCHFPRQSQSETSTSKHLQEGMTSTCNLPISLPDSAMVTCKKMGMSSELGARRSADLNTLWQVCFWPKISCCVWPKISSFGDGRFAVAKVIFTK